MTDEHDPRLDDLKRRLKILAGLNVDTPMGVERTAAALQGLDDVFRVETLSPLVERVEQLAAKHYESDPRAFRVIVDHLRAATFAIADGALPSIKDASYYKPAWRFGRSVRRWALSWAPSPMHERERQRGSRRSSWLRQRATWPGYSP